MYVLNTTKNLVSMYPLKIKFAFCVKIDINDSTYFLSVKNKVIFRLYLLSYVLYVSTKNLLSLNENSIIMIKKIYES